MSDSANCPECGAARVDGDACAAQLERLLAMEYPSPKRMRVLT